MESLGQILTVLMKYQTLMNNNHLIEQISQYDAQVKEYDKHFVSQDDQVIKTLASKNANDEHLDNNELKKLFSQQVRKFMNNEVKQREKVIKSNVKLGIMGSQSKAVDYIMYLSIVFALYFGYIAFKKLQEQKDSLVI